MKGKKYLSILLAMIFMYGNLTIAFSVDTWTDWSDWSTSFVYETPTRIVEEKTQYCYEEVQNCTSTQSELPGWNQVSSYEEYGKWSDWKRGNVPNKSGHEYQQTVLYRYYYYACTCGNRQPYWARNCTSCGKYVNNNLKEYKWSTTAYKNSSYKKYDDLKSVTTVFDGGKKWFFSTGNVKDTSPGTKDYAGYPNPAIVIDNGYKERTTTTVYMFERTVTSDWSFNEPEYTSDRTVYSRTVYRYKDMIIKPTSVSVDAPSSLNVSSQTDSSITLCWPSVSETNGYAIQQKIDGSYKTIKRTTKTTYTVDSLKPARKYYFRIKAYKTIDGVRYYSNSSSKLTAVTKPSRTSFINISATSNVINVSWRKNDCTGYQIYISTNNDFTNAKKILIPDSSEVKKEITSLKSSTKYYLKIRSYKSLGDLKYFGSWSEIKNITTKKSVSVSVGTVTGLKLTTGGKSKQIKLSWSKVSGASGYQIYRSTTGQSGSYVKIATVKATSYTDTKLKNSMSYYYAVKAYKNSNSKTYKGKSAYSNLSTRITASYAEKLFINACRTINKFGSMGGGKLQEDNYSSEYKRIFSDGTTADYYDRSDFNNRKDYVYITVDDKFYTSKSQIEKELKKFFSAEIANNVVSEGYIDRDGRVYGAFMEEFGVTSEVISRKVNTTCKRIKDREVELKIDYEYTTCDIDMDNYETINTSYILNLKYINGKWVFTDTDFWTFLGVTPYSLVS